MGYTTINGKVIRQGKAFIRGGWRRDTAMFQGAAAKHDGRACNLNAESPFTSDEQNPKMPLVVTHDLRNQLIDSKENGL